MRLVFKSYNFRYMNHEYENIRENIKQKSEYIFIFIALLYVENVYVQI